MDKYYPMYRCRLCGASLAGPAVDLDSNQLPDALGRMIKMQRFRDNPYLAGGIPPMVIPHHCRDGWAGLASFAGFKKIHE